MNRDKRKGRWRRPDQSPPNRNQESRTQRYRGTGRLYLVGGGGHGQESPDVRITEEDRQLVRHVVAELESALSAEVLMLVSGGVKAAAWRKQALEDSA